LREVYNPVSGNPTYQDLTPQKLWPNIPISA
jgi:hypothetical protein